MLSINDYSFGIGKQHVCLKHRVKTLNLYLKVQLRGAIVRVVHRARTLFSLWTEVNFVTFVLKVETVTVTARNK